MFQFSRYEHQQLDPSRLGFEDQASGSEQPAVVAGTEASTLQVSGQQNKTSGGGRAVGAIAANLRVVRAFFWPRKPKLLR